MISASLLSADFMRLADEIQAIEDAGVDMLHLDIMDGRFVPNLTFGQFIVEQVRKVTNLPLDVHLMVVSPEDYIKPFADAGADILTVHAEASIHLHRLLDSIRSKGIKAGVALNPSTPISVISEIVNMLDIVMIMTVNPGFGGQKFITDGIDKIRRIKKFLKQSDSSAMIEVDGGVNNNNATLLWEAGADILVSGSHIFCSPDYAEAIALIRKPL